MKPITIFLLLISSLALQAQDHLRQWGQWRGPLGTGEAPIADPPTQWSEDQNIVWKIPISGRGHSTPVIWENLIFLTTAIEHGDQIPIEIKHSHGSHDNMTARRKHKFMVMAFNRDTGDLIWAQEVADAIPSDTTHVSGTWASHSPVTDGVHVIASFGSGGVYAMDINGNLLWKKDLGKMSIKHGHGEGSSPALYKDKLVVNWDHEGASFLIAIDKNTGETLWKKDRNEKTSWSSPLIHVFEGKPQVIVAATGRVRSYDIQTGSVIWECGGLSGNVVASPVAANDMVFVANSYDTRSMLAINIRGAKGDITGSDRVIWRRNRDTPYVPSPVLHRGSLYFLKHYQGIITNVDAKTGATHYGPQRLPGIRNVYASLASAKNRIYIVDLSGTTLVLEHGPNFKVIAQNQLDETFSASPAIVGNSLFLRGDSHLYHIRQ